MSTHNPIISSREIARLIDISAVRADSTRQDVEDIIDGAIKHNFICVFPMPGMLPLVFEKLKDNPADQSRRFPSSFKSNHGSRPPHR